MTKPFMFDFSFDDGADDRRREEEEALAQAEAQAEASKPPTFTVEEMEAAKAQSHAAGRQEGMADAMAGIEQQMARTLDMMFSKLPDVFKRHEAWTRQMETDALRLANTFMRRLAPELTRGNELPEVENVIREAFGFLTEQPKVIIRVSSALEEPLKDKVVLMATRVGYEGQVVLVGDPELVDDDCRVSWQAGAVERSVDSIWNSLDEIVERALSGRADREHGIYDDDGEMPQAVEEAGEVAEEPEALHDNSEGLDAAPAEQVEVRAEADDPVEIADPDETAPDALDVDESEPAHTS